MNKKIQELFAKTTLHRNDHTVEQRHAEIEKFAELIIKECAGVYEAIDNGNKVEGTDNYVLALRRKFEL